MQCHIYDQKDQGIYRPYWLQEHLAPCYSADTDIWKYVCMCVFHDIALISFAFQFSCPLDSVSPHAAFIAATFVREN